jgi:glycosyltransferase involved in cell wall biosynthesis
VEYTLTQPLVSIFIPCYNEEKTIGLLLDAIRNQTYPLDHLEVVIADASSTDGTRQVIADYQQMHPEMRIQVVENPRRIIPAGLNAAIRASSGEILTRLDAHSIPAANYIELSVLALLEGRGQNVGGVIEIKPGGDSWIARSIAVAAAHPLGVGDARYRWATQAGPADTVAFGTFYRELFEHIGYYDETLLINEDYELNTRIRRSGGVIWVDPAIKAVYFSRSDLRSLARQYFSYGYWKFKMLKRYPGSLRWRQAIPPLFVAGILMLLLCSVFWSFARLMLGLSLGFYLLVLLAGSIAPARKKQDSGMLLGIPLAIMTMHLSWGTGFIWSLLHGGSAR